MDIADVTTPPTTYPSLAVRVRRAARWTTLGALLAGVGGATALVAGLTGHGATSSEAHPSITPTMGLPYPLVAVLLGAAGLLVALGLVRLRALVGAIGRDGTDRRGPAQTITAVGAAGVAALALAAVCDANPLALTGYLPAMLVMAPFSEEMRLALASVPWPPMLAELAVVGTTAVVVLGAVTALDALRGDAPRPRWQQPAAAARWGRTAVGVAVAAPLLYAVTRVAWVLGWPIGFDMASFEAAGGDVSNGLMLSAAAVVGSVLTIGLVRPWGERFWPWLPGLGGRRVPVPLAVVPASLVAAMLLPAGMSMIVGAVQGIGVAGLASLADNWAAVGVTFLWPVWSVALAAATWAYALRRDGDRVAVTTAA